jgi:phosphatidylglycerol:prolipoprotein diacylglycerol transferase
MQKYMYVGELRIPSYAMAVALGIAFCCVLVLVVAKTKNISYEPITIAGFLGSIGSVIGAKSLTMVQNYLTGNPDAFTWDSFKDAEYSYYGGLAMFLIVLTLTLKFHVSDSRKYLSSYIFLLPLLHVFWKIGCFLGGCCYGIPYNGPFAVVFPEGINTLSGQLVFPVQLLEALLAFAIAVVLVILNQCNKLVSPIGVYLLLYGFTRFFAEFLRYHEKRNVLSDGQLYSMISIALGLVMIYMSYRGLENERSRTKNI